MPKALQVFEKYSGTQRILIIITGHPATGKTFFSHQLAGQLGLPCVNKDEIKERLADDLGVKDREESKKVGKASYTIMDYVMETYLRAGISLIIESNFPAEFYTDKIGSLIQRYAYYPIQILCKADPDELMRRVVKRIESGERHASHMESDDVASGIYRKRLGDGRIEPLAIGGELLELDTTRFKTLNYQEIGKQVEKVIAKARVRIKY